MTETFGLDVPDDFPRDFEQASLSGVHPKVAVVRDAVSGTFRLPPATVEIVARYEMCRDLASQLVAKVQANRSGKYASFTDQEILGQLLRKLTATNWGTHAEMTWTVLQVSKELGWAWE